MPENPYVALWARLEGFEPAELSTLIADRRAVRAQLMRATIHLATAEDCLAMLPVTLPVLARTFKSAFTRRLAGADVEAVIAAGRHALAERPRTRAELAALLAPGWPDTDPGVLAQAVTFHLPLVQVPPRGLWRGVGQPTWTLAADWLGAEVGADAAADALVLRYLAAFGPASAADVRTWSRFTGLRPVLERLRPGLRTFRDERGRELFDVPDGALPDPATPAPVRFLPEYDNVLLSHDDRSRMLTGLGPGLPYPTGATVGTLLVDGFYRAYWKLERDAATLTVDRFTPHPDDPPGTRQEIAAEGERLLAFIAPELPGRVAFVP